MSFWQKIPKPIIALSPMDGVTDASFRFITAKYGRPDLFLTEFTSVEAICSGAEGFLRDLAYTEAERPIVAQIYGRTPGAFYRVAHVVCELGFDGLDINMGCPAKKVAAQGCGAGLILNPALALGIIRAARQGVRDWAAGQNLQDLGLLPGLIAHVRRMNQRRGAWAEGGRRNEIPVSVKTRIGYDQIVVEEWVRTLLAERPAAVSLHGRTLKQMYRGDADWDAIARAAAVARGSETLILGNGDVKSMQDVVRRVAETGVDGVLIGRSALGNPWIFRRKEEAKQALKEKSWRASEFLAGETVEKDERVAILLEHSRHFENLWGRARFPAMRKHLAWYCKGFPGASRWRSQMVQANNTEEVRAIVGT